MNKNHSQNLPEKKLDRFAREIARSIILTDEEVDEIANSPRLWWQVQSRIHEEKARHEKRRFFVWRWQFAATGALAILVLAIGAFLISNPAKQEIAAVQSEKTAAIVEQKIDSPSEIKPGTTNQKAPITEQKKSTIKAERKLMQMALKLKPASSFIAQRKPLQTKKPVPQKAEIATDFIALSYLPATESGQIVRVKVPRSMLVSLGVTTNVGKPSELVNAEVIVGDDGGTRAIRFLAN